MSSPPVLGTVVPGRLQREELEMAVAAVSKQQGTQQVRRSGFVLMPVYVACDTDLTDGAFRTFCILKRYCFGRRSYCWPSIRTLAAEQGCTEETIRRHLRELVDAGLITISKRGRRNVYHFAEEYEPADRGEAAAVSSPGSVEHRGGPAPQSGEEPSPQIPEPQLGPTPHTNEGQGIRESRNQESTSCVGEAIIPSPDPEDPTLSCLVACGVSLPTARRLLAKHGAPLCRQAIELLHNYRANGADIRNPGGWLHSAITHGYLTPRDVEPQPQGRSPGGESPPPDEARRAGQHEQALARAQAEEVRQRRREALARRGITPEVEDLWQRVVEHLKAQGHWKPILAAAYLRPIGEREYAVQCLIGGQTARLGEMLPVVEAALRRQTGRPDCRVSAVR